MRILVPGSTGFIGRAVVEAARERGHEVVAASSTPGAGTPLDPQDPASITRVLRDIRPDALINCTASLGPGVATFLQAIPPARMHSLVILGSAAEYGSVRPAGALVPETRTQRPLTGYALLKAIEVNTALLYGRSRALPLAVARIFNPLGPGMNPCMLIPRVLDQLADQGERPTQVRINRRDSLRDYFDVRDAADAILALTERGSEGVYNIGSGSSTSNGELIERLIAAMDVECRIVETEYRPTEPLAARADITRLRDHTGWAPRYALSDIVKHLSRGLVATGAL